MIRGTTPTFTLMLKDQNINLNEAITVIATIKQCDTRINISGDRLQIDGYTVSLWLTQAESLKLDKGTTASIQLNWTYTNENGGTPRRAATVPKRFTIDEQFYERVIE